MFYLVGVCMVMYIGLGCLVDGMGIFYVIGSYCGNMMVLVMVCCDVLLDLEVYVDCIDEVFGELKVMIVKCL